MSVSMRDIRDDEMSSEAEVVIPLKPDLRKKVRDAIETLYEFRKIALRKLKVDIAEGEAVAVNYRIEDSNLVVNVVQGIVVPNGEQVDSEEDPDESNEDSDE